MEFKNENTKEIINLEQLREKAVDTLEMEIIEEMDENMMESTQSFETITEEKEDQENNKEEKAKKKANWKEKWNNLKEKWVALPKKKKILIIIASVIVLILCIGSIVFFLITRKNEKGPEIKDVIVDLDNYRYKNGKLVFLDETKKEIGEYACENEDQELCYVAYYSDEDQFDEPKYIYEDESNIKQRSSIFLNQYVFVYDNKEKENGSIKLYDLQKKEVTDEFLLVKGYDKLRNQIVFKDKNNQYGLLELTSESIDMKIMPQYDYLGVMNSKDSIDRAIGKQNGKWYLTDFSANNLTKPIAGEIKDYNDHYIKIMDDYGNYHAVDYNGNEINSDSYDYIDLLEEYVFFIKDQKIWIENYEHQKMNMEGIALSNKNYIPTYTYSKEKKLIKTEKSYEITYQGKTMNIEIMDNNGDIHDKKSINLNEGRVSANLSFLSYYDGKLYIFKDKEKNELLGTYSCENKNSISDDTNELNNCAIAKESYYEDNDREAVQNGDLGVLPVFNERYVFIADQKNESDLNIVLYDLKENANKSKYKTVDTGTYTKSHDITFVNVNNSYIIAENKNGKFGIIRINTNSVEGVKEFDYNHIERIGLYYIIQNSSGYALMDHSGNILTSSVTNKIRDFDLDAKYLVTKESKYHLYNLEGKALTPSGYDYISLYNNYFGAVSNQTLNFYSYDNPDKALTEGIKLERNNYYGEGTLAYKVTITGTNARVQIGKNNNTYETKNVSLIPKTAESNGDAS